MKIGDRVIHLEDGLIGIVESVNVEWCDVRWQTPNDKPSCLTSSTFISSLEIVPSYVRPMPISKEKQEEADRFYEAILQAIDEAER